MKLKLLCMVIRAQRDCSRTTSPAPFLPLPLLNISDTDSRLAMLFPLQVPLTLQPFLPLTIWENPSRPRMDSLALLWSFPWPSAPRYIQLNPHYCTSKVPWTSFIYDTSHMASSQLACLSVSPVEQLEVMSYSSLYCPWQNQNPHDSI